MRHFVYVAIAVNMLIHLTWTEHNQDALAIVLIQVYTVEYTAK